MNDRVRITKYKNIFSKGYPKNKQRENNRKFLGKRIVREYIIDELLFRTR